MSVPTYTLQVPATRDQILGLIGKISHDFPRWKIQRGGRKSRLQLRFGTCTMLPPTTAEEKAFPGTVSAEYALAMLNESLPKPKKPDVKRLRLTKQLMTTLVSNITQEQSNLQMFVNTLNAHPGNFINPDVFADSLEQIQENLDRLTACVAELPSTPVPPTPASVMTAYPPTGQFATAAVPPTPANLL